MIMVMAVGKADPGSHGVCSLLSAEGVLHSPGLAPPPFVPPEKLIWMASACLLWIDIRLQFAMPFHLQECILACQPGVRLVMN